MKPHELIAALMDQEGGSLPLARKMGKPQLQAPLWRFAHGLVTSPAHSTAKALADYFHLPLEAIYDERVATSIAQQRGVHAPPKPALPREPKPKAVLDHATMLEAFRKLTAMTEEERAEFLRDANVTQPGDLPLLGGHNSGFGVFPPTHASKKVKKK